MDILDYAIIFATNAHSGMLRKATEIPYITHPLEVVTIISTMTNDKEVMAAGALHDTIEDCKTISIESIINLFGDNVANLVLHESEDKTKTWKERKSKTLEDLKTATIDVKIITLADKLSNMRATLRDFETIGDCVWERFNEKDKSEQEWYYRGIIENMKELRDFSAYKEYEKILETVFV